MSINETIKQLVRERANYLCEYCHSPELLSANRFTIDHIIPRSLDGSDDLDNLALACRRYSNVDRLQTKIDNFQAKVSQLESVEERLKLEKDILILEKDRTTIENGIYTTLVQAIGGLILSVTAYVGYRNFKIGEKNLKVAEDKQVTERFSKAIEHLGNEKIDIRLGGIYALEQIAIDSPTKYHWTIMEILSAFVREKATIQQPDMEILSTFVWEKATIQKPDADGNNPKPKLTVDVKAAVNVICRRKVNFDPEGKQIDLRNVDLKGIEVEKGANLIRSPAKMDKVELRGCLEIRRLTDLQHIYHTDQNEKPRV